MGSGALASRSAEAITASPATRDPSRKTLFIIKLSDWQERQVRG
jgi:hypothetical protein